MSLMLMAIECAIVSYFPNQFEFKNERTLAIIMTLWMIGICLAIPVLTHHIPVEPLQLRYHCTVDRLAFFF